MSRTIAEIEAGAVDYEDIRKHGACIQRGHDLRQVGESAYYRCKCGATALVKGGRIELDHGQPMTKGEKAAAREARKQKFIKERGAFLPNRT
jgi:hypothetical protein